MPDIQFNASGKILFSATGKVLFDCDCCGIACASADQCGACGSQTPTHWSLDLEGVVHCCTYCDAWPLYDLAIVDADDAGAIDETAVCLGQGDFASECPQGYANADANCRWAARFSVSERKFSSTDARCATLTSTTTRTATAYLWHTAGVWTLHVLVNRQSCPNIGYLSTLFHGQLNASTCPTAMTFANDQTSSDCGDASTHCYTTGAIVGGYDGTATVTACCA